MVTFLFWNVARKPLQERLARLVHHYQVDILILAESKISPALMLRKLNQQLPATFQESNELCEKVSIYARFSPERLQPYFESERLTIRRLTLPDCDEILLAAVHLPEKGRWRDDSQGFATLELASHIRRVEAELGHTRTLLVGDLNMNPFEAGIVAASGLHGVMTRKVALQAARKVQKADYPFFYNPMWSLLGDGRGEPAGTYYYRRGEQVLYFWHMFDQVLLRPALLSRFRNEELRILVDDGSQSLLSKSGLPDRANASDHLPILFTLHLERSKADGSKRT